jgi:hypothetical protein
MAREERETTDAVRLKLADLSRQVSESDKAPGHQAWINAKAGITQVAGPILGPAALLVGAGGLGAGMALALPVLVPVLIIVAIPTIIFAGIWTGHNYNTMSEWDLEEKADEIRREPSRASKKLVEETMKRGSPELQALLGLALKDRREVTLGEKIYSAAERLDAEFKRSIIEEDAEKLQTAIDAGAKIDNIEWESIHDPQIGAILVENAPDEELVAASKTERALPFVKRERARRVLRTTKKESGLEI